MTRHFAVLEQRKDNARWHNAFPQGEVVSPAESSWRVHAGACAWVMAEEDWPHLVKHLVNKQAVVVVMAYSPDNTQAVQALSLGARGYVHALSPTPLLQRVATVVTNKGLWIGEDLLAQLAGATYKALGGGNPHAEELEQLTSRERMVAEAVARGRTNKEVARELDITERTVKAHLGHVFRKLEVRDRLQLVRLMADIKTPAG